MKNKTASSSRYTQTKLRCYISVPTAEKEVAMQLGARWDAEELCWYAPSSEEALLSRWGLINANSIRELNGEDRNFSGYLLRQYLDVPDTEKEIAESTGACWDPHVRKWFAPNRESELIEKWPLKDSTFLRNRLFVDLIPTTCWFTNVRYCVRVSDWDRLRRLVYKRAGNKCECCGVKGRLEAHERWHYDHEKKIQKLMRIVGLCHECHETTHMGLAGIRGRSEFAKNHLMKVTGMNSDEVSEHTRAAFQLWSARNKYTWELDLSIITDSGIKLKQKVEETERPSIASTKLQGITANRMRSLPDEELSSLSGPPRNRPRKANQLPTQSHNNSGTYPARQLTLLSFFQKDKQKTELQPDPDATKLIN